MASQLVSAADDEGEFVGRSVQRREDGRLVRGTAEYCDDIRYPDGLHLAILRSQYGHATINGIDTSAAEARPGVRAVYTHADLIEAGLDGTIPGGTPDHGVTVDRPLLVGERARYQGDPIAGVVATDRYTAYDALNDIEVDYERHDAIPDITHARDDGAPVIHEEAPDNVAFHWTGGDQTATEAAFDAADRVVEVDLGINKVMGVPMEPRSAVARYNPGTGRLRVDASCQNVLYIQDDLASVLGIPEHKISVRAPDVGGGFGVKIFAYTGHILAAFCAVQHGKPIKWTARRSEDLQSTTHARRHEVTARAALNADNTITGLHVESLADVGGYIAPGGARVPASNVAKRLLGAYDIPNTYTEITGVFTTTTPLTAYRGAGRPEATYIIERLVSACARDLDIDPVEFRRRNFIQPDQFPYESPYGSVYDSGDYEKPLDKALDIIDYDGFRDRQAQAREDGRLLGIGFSTYIEICGGGAGQVQGGTVKMLPSGTVRAACSMVENGQGHSTSFAQIIADELGITPEDIEFDNADTDHIPEGGGTGGSKAIAMAGNALKVSAEQLKERARRIAAHHLEASPDDIDFEDGEFFVRGAPTRALTIQEVAANAHSSDLAPDLRGLEDTSFFSPHGSTTPFGTHVAIVEIDPDTGDLSFEQFVAVDDVGNQINPLLLEGQIVGGIIQSVGQAVYEDVRYDDNGNLVTGSFQDYTVPKAFHAPDITWDSTITPSPNNPLGVKGVGEAGTIGSMPAIVNAAIDALTHLGVTHLDMPLTSDKLWHTIQQHTD